MNRFILYTMNIYRLIMRLIGWRIHDALPYRKQCVICVAPHTSNIDFVIAKLAYASINRKAKFLMKKEWFFFPLGLYLRSIGGIPVNRKKSENLIEKLSWMFTNNAQCNLAIAPEGTRKANENWHKGFLRIATNANIPIQCGVIDYKNKCVLIEKEFFPSGDIDSDLALIKKYVAQFSDAAKYPSKSQF